MNKRVLYFDWFSQATEFYRLLPLSYITSKNFTISRSTDINITFMLIEQYDIFIIERPASDDSLKLVKMIKDHGKKIILDFDDDCLHLPKGHPLYDTYERQKSNIIKCLSMADEVWVATEGIKKSFSLYNKNIHIIPNCHNENIFPVKNKRDFTYNKIAMWRGGGSHNGDILPSGTSEWIVYLINNNKDWKFYWLGQNFEYIERRVGDNFYWNPGASTIQFYKMMHDYNACLFYYPLTQNIFNQSKSNCSWIESTYSGSAYFGNTNLNEFKKDSIEEIVLLNDLSDLNEKDLNNMNKQSWEYICDNLLIKNSNKIRKERLELI